MYREHSLPRDCHLLVPLKQNLVDHDEFNDSFESWDKMTDKQGHGMVRRRNRMSRSTIRKIPGFCIIYFAPSIHNIHQTRSNN